MLHPTITNSATDEKAVERCIADPFFLQRPKHESLDQSCTVELLARNRPYTAGRLKVSKIATIVKQLRNSSHVAFHSYYLAQTRI